jgi:hypothetical protein
MLKRLIACCGLVVLCAAPTVAQQRADLEKCRAISDSLERLRCFDALVVPSGAKKEPAPSGQAMSATDFILDRAKLRGQQVVVSGVVQIMGDTAMIKRTAMDMSVAFVDFKKVSRDQRRKLLENCDLGCDAVVRGRAAEVMFEVGIVADSIELK